MSSQLAGELAETERRTLASRYDILVADIDQAQERYDAYLSQSNAEVEEADSKIPDLGDRPTELEYLTMRAAQVDQDLIAANTGVTAAKMWLELQELHLQVEHLELRIGVLDHATESGAAAAGNDEQLKTMLIDVEERAIVRGHALTMLDVANRRLAATKILHKKVHAGLRALRRPTKKAGGGQPSKNTPAG